METKKISFGFSKINKKPNFLQTKENVSNVELIKCLEGQEIKLVEEKPEEQPLIIHIKESQKTSAALASLMKRRAVLLGEEEPQCSDKLAEPSNSLKNEFPEDIEKRAARELLAEVQKNGSSDPDNNLVLPVVKPDDLPLDGAKESTLDDYESIPIQDFGKAMLRGMGWSEPTATPNQKGAPIIHDVPVARPKGMGLGADKAISKKNPLVAPESNEVLEIKRNGYVLILGGKYKDLYGQIEGFDDDAGRVIVKMAIGGAKEVFNEFLCQPVSRKEYGQYGKCVNYSKYEEYKRKENEHGQIILDKQDKRFDDKNKKNIKNEQYHSFESKYNKNSDDYKRICQPKDKEIHMKRRDSFGIRDKEDDRKSTYDKYDSKNHIKKEDRERRKHPSYNEYNRDNKREYNRDDVSDIGKEHNDRNYKNDISHRERNVYVSKSNHAGDRDKNAKDYCSSSNIYRDKQRERDGDNCDTSDSENDSYISKHKKSKKAKSKISKKSKKRKSKYKNNSSESEAATSSMNSSSDSEEEKYKKYRKKTKKSKKQRERSRSRGRR